MIPTIPPSDFGRDHWSMLAYAFSQLGSGGALDLNRLRTDPRYPTRLYQGPGQVERRVLDHSDMDCLRDLEVAGVLRNIGVGVMPIIQFTPEGLKLGQWLAHEMSTRRVKTSELAYADALAASGANLLLGDVVEALPSSSPIANSAVLGGFPGSLQKVLLCGHSHLPGCPGALLNLESDDFWTWDPLQQRALRSGHASLQVLAEPARWALPLEEEFPWAWRLAAVAAWMTGLTMGEGHADIEFHFPIGSSSAILGLAWWSSAFGERFLGWSAKTGVPLDQLPGGRPTVHSGIRLLTLERHLSGHRPDVALVHALYDVPEIQARVDAALSPPGSSTGPEPGGSEPITEDDRPDPNQCPARKGGNRCHRLRDLHVEHHDLITDARWRDGWEA